MSTPLGHLFASIPIALGFSRAVAKPKWPIFVLAPFFTCIHDVSYPILKLFGINLGHREITHSLLMCIPFALLSALIFKHLYKNFKLGLWFGATCYCSHLILDMAASLTGPMIFFPFSESRIDFPIHFMPVAEPRIGSVAFNLICIFYEFLIFASITLLMLRKARIISLIILSFALLGSVRQSNFRSYIWFQAPKEHLNRYLENLDEYSPWHFSTFTEGQPGLTKN